MPEKVPTSLCSAEFFIEVSAVGMQQLMMNAGLSSSPFLSKTATSASLNFQEVIGLSLWPIRRKLMERPKSNCVTLL